MRLGDLAGTKTRLALVAVLVSVRRLSRFLMGVVRGWDCGVLWFGARMLGGFYFLRFFLSE